MFTLRPPAGLVVMVHPQLAFAFAAYCCTSRRMPSIGSPHISSPFVRPFLVKCRFHFPGCMSGTIAPPPPGEFAGAPVLGGVMSSFEPGQGLAEYDVLPSLPTHL